MTGKTSIEWATAVWNPTTGCTRVSDGCDNCYAFALHDKRYKVNLDFARLHVATSVMLERHITDMSWMALAETLNFVKSEWIDEARRLGYKMPFPKQYDRPFSRVQLLPERLDHPLRHKKPERYFVDSMADLFHEDVPDEYLDRVFLRMALNRRHTFLVLTKRPERMANYCKRAMPAAAFDSELDTIVPFLTVEERAEVGAWARLTVMGLAEPPRNIWLGTSVEDQRSADERIPHLLATPAAVRFLSCEPLLGPVDLTKWIGGGVVTIDRPISDAEIAELRERWSANAVGPVLAQGMTIERLHTLDWVIVGGESGPRARPMELSWARSIVEQCRAAGIARFVKQLGKLPLMTSDAGTETVHLYQRESHGRDMAEWPEDLRVREFPGQLP